MWPFSSRPKRPAVPDADLQRWAQGTVETSRGLAASLLLHPALAPGPDEPADRAPMRVAASVVLEMLMWRHLTPTLVQRERERFVAHWFTAAGPGEAADREEMTRFAVSGAALPGEAFGAYLLLRRVGRDSGRGVVPQEAAEIERIAREAAEAAALVVYGERVVAAP